MKRLPLRPQRGTALIIAMLFLVILGMLGVTTMTATTLEERMAGNTRDRDIAMQAAEAALRDAERDLTNTVVATGRVVTLANFIAACTAGLCTEGAPILTNIDDPAKSAYFTQFATSPQALQGTGGAAALHHRAPDRHAAAGPGAAGGPADPQLPHHGQGVRPEHEHGRDPADRVPADHMSTS